MWRDVQGLPVVGLVLLVVIVVGVVAAVRRSRLGYLSLALSLGLVAAWFLYYALSILGVSLPSVGKRALLPGLGVVIIAGMSGLLGAVWGKHA